MSSLLDSEAQFASRAKEIGLGQAVVRDLKAAEVANLSQLASACRQPGQPIVPAEVDAFLMSSLGRGATLAESAAVRRLAFEAQTMLVASLRQIVEQRGDGAPKKV